MRKKLSDSALLTGWVGKDPETRQTNSGAAVVSISLRTENYKDDNGEWQSKWDNVTCFGAAATAAQTLQKGDTIMVVGTPKTRSYKAKDGTDKTATEVVADFISVMPRGEEVATNTPIAAKTDDFADVTDSGDLPF